MGVPALAQYYFRKYNKQHELSISSKSIQNLSIYSLFFDYNSLIHPCAYNTLSKLQKDQTYSEEELDSEIIKTTLSYTLEIIKLVAAKKIYIVIDGVAPRSKMIQQRERRYKAYFLKKIQREQKEYQFSQLSEEMQENLRDEYREPPVWDSNKITPGTRFMKTLHKELYKFKKNYELEFDIFISTSDDPGEGEHKIMKLIEKDTNTHHIHCIYGLDADLIMLSLLNKNSDQIILLRDHSFQEKLDALYDFLHIGTLKKYICQDIEDPYKANYIYDYILLCFFLGNDFLEHLPGLKIKHRGIDMVLHAYTKAKKMNTSLFLVDIHKINDPIHWNTSINLEFLKDIFYILKNNQQCYSIVDLKENLPIENCDKMYMYTNDTQLSYIDNKLQYHRYYDLSTDVIHDACFNYIEGLYWILGYYNGHIHDNWSWYYKYDNVPSPEDIFFYLLEQSKQNQFNILQESLIKSCQLQKTPCYSMLKQLFLVLPKESLLTILDDSLLYDVSISRKKIESKIRSLNTVFPDVLFLDLVNKEFMWQSKVFFKDIDETMLDAFLSTL